MIKFSDNLVQHNSNIIYTADNVTFNNEEANKVWEIIKEVYGFSKISCISFMNGKFCYKTYLGDKELDIFRFLIFGIRRGIDIARPN